MRIKIMQVLLLAILGYSLAGDTPEDLPRIGKCDTMCTTEYSPVTGMDSNGKEKDFGNCCGLYFHNECYGTDYSTKSCKESRNSNCET